MSKKIAIIGGGNLGASIAEGLIQSEFSRPVEISITRRNLSPLSRFAEQGSMVHSDNKKAVKTAEIIILAVKPYNFADIIEEIRTTLDPRKHFGGVSGDWSYSSVDVKKNASRGFTFETGFIYRDNLDKTSSYLNLRGSFSFFMSLGRRLVFAHRTGGATNFGEYDFYYANTLGRSENLRGYWRHRFSGRTNFYQNSELRLRLSKRGNFGILGFIDDGKVWIEDEDSKTLHIGYGGGFYFVPFNALGLNVCYGKSNETSMIMIKTGFLF